jgi:hypothetical protein
MSSAAKTDRRPAISFSFRITSAGDACRRPRGLFVNQIDLIAAVTIAMAVSVTPLLLTVQTLRSAIPPRRPTTQRARGKLDCAAPSSPDMISNLGIAEPGAANDGDSSDRGRGVRSAEQASAPLLGDQDAAMTSKQIALRILNGIIIAFLGVLVLSLIGLPMPSLIHMSPGEWRGFSIFIVLAAIWLIHAIEASDSAP